MVANYFSVDFPTLEEVERALLSRGGARGHAARGASSPARSAAPRTTSTRRSTGSRCSATSPATGTAGGSATGSSSAGCGGGSPPRARPRLDLREACRSGGSADRAGTPSSPEPFLRNRQSVGIRRPSAHVTGRLSRSDDAVDIEGSRRRTRLAAARAPSACCGGAADGDHRHRRPSARGQPRRATGARRRRRCRARPRRPAPRPPRGAPSAAAATMRSRSSCAAIRAGRRPEVEEVVERQRAGRPAASASTMRSAFRSCTSSSVGTGELLAPRRGSA